MGIMRRGETQRHCEALIIACSDYRFTDDLHRFLSDNNLLYGTDQLIMPGGIKSIASNSASRQVDLDRIALLWKLHHFKDIIFNSHEDCGAYGGSEQFHGDHKLERRRHLQDMKAARLAIDELVSRLEEETGIEHIDISVVLVYARVKPEKTDDYNFEILEDLDGVLGRPTAPPEERPVAFV